MADSGIKVEFDDRVVNTNNSATAAVGLYVAGTKVVGAQASVIAAATSATGTASGSVFAQFNLVLAALKTHGLIASS